MQLRNSVFQVAALATLLVACGGRDGNPDGGDAGCIGVCNNDGGQDAGDGGPCSGVPADMGPVTIAQLRNTPVCGQKVFLAGVVVNGVGFVQDGGATRCVQGGGSDRAEFWVAPGDGGVGGILINKYCDDTPVNYVPAKGHKVNVAGYVSEPAARSGSLKGPPHSTDRYGYRLEVAQLFNWDPSTPSGTGTMAVTPLNGGNAFATVQGDSSFGADAGSAIVHDELRGTRVHIPGPIYLEDASPTFMVRYNAEYNDAGSPLYVRDIGNNYTGFTVTGGIPVFDVIARGSSDGGPTGGHTEACDWRNHFITDGGSNRLVFPEGITGVWDSLTMVPFVNHCADGTTNFFSCVPSGYIPAPDGGRLGDRVNALYVTDCADYGDAGFVP